MSRIRSSMILLGICVIALLIGVLRLVTERPTLPTGSSYSTDPSGAQGLYEWLGAVGVSTSRLTEAVVSDQSPPASLLVLQPESVIDPTARQAFDTVAEHGGTLIVAGDSLSWVIYARSLGVTVEPIRPTASLVDGSLSPDAAARYRLRGDNLVPLLMTSDGDWIAARKSYKQGTLIVIATPDPLLNHALRNDDTARWVYRNLLQGATTIAVDEAHHSYTPPTANVPMTFDRLVLTSAAGRALVYACFIVFVFVALTGRRLGPAIGGRGPTETRRTMYEHVQMLANLYRRAGQFSVVRAAFARSVARDVARSSVSAEALARVERARNESELIAAVRDL
jgi:hypothetical protein